MNARGKRTIGVFMEGRGDDFKGFVLGDTVATWRAWMGEPVIRGTDDRIAMITVPRRYDEGLF